MPLNKDGVMIILSSPSGAGKTTLANKLSELDNFEVSISHTTRQPRPNEIPNKDYYFVHSYLAITSKPQNTFAYCKYFDVKVPAILTQENIIGCQFHPEKSGKTGLVFLKNALTY